MVSSNLSVATPATEPAKAFDWPLCHDAERVMRRHLEAAVQRSPLLARLDQRMRDETGTDLFEWVDHVVLPHEAAVESELRAAGFEEEAVELPSGVAALWHPRAMMPRVLLRDGGKGATGPGEIALRVEAVADFLGAHDIAAPIEGAPLAHYRRAWVEENDGLHVGVVERMGYRGFVVRDPAPAFVRGVLEARELWRSRKRNFTRDADGVQHAMERLDAVLARVGRDVACDLFFAEERRFWEAKNRAAQIQKRRQDRLGLGWANHDHHTFRSSREHFADLMQFLAKLGFEKRERYYAGAEAGWGAQILEQAVAGIVVFADVDLMPDETQIDFSSHRLPPAPQLRTVGLWCGLHGDSFLQAGMHHLEARFDFALLRDQLALQGVNTMRPFSDFDFLRQAFTEGERWSVRPERVARLREAGLITAAQAEGFLRDGAIGSHLENLQRKGGFKGFNQKSVSVIIAATDPRKVQSGH